MLVALQIQIHVNDGKLKVYDICVTVASHMTRMLSWAYKENELDLTLIVVMTARPFTIVYNEQTS
jgi:hypothetical protein